MKGRKGILTIGIIFTVAALLKLLVLFGLIPMNSAAFEHFMTTIEPYFAPCLILVMGVAFISTAIKEGKK
ncbi:MAG: hypothetical protein IJS57_02455 [Paludibacteraceae bacterium]|nr:hypothetical protein [Paludibacteraceae bacterium]